MDIHSQAAPPTPWSKTFAEPKIHDTAYVHSFSNLIGDVRVSPKVLIAPGTSIRADEGALFYIGASTNIQDGVVIHGLEQGRVIGDDQQSYSVWIGENSCITHMVLIHGPAYIGNDCFIGFRSTVFNAKVGHGCIVMMHVLIQDVEIPPGKYVSPGAVITTQQEANRLPDAKQEDQQFAHHVVQINEALLAGYRCAEDVSCLASIKNEMSSTNGSRHDGRYSDLPNSSQLSSEVVKQVRSLLHQGYRIGTEHADRRRFKTSSWQSGVPIRASQEAQVLAQLEDCLAAHPQEYVCLVGIDPVLKQRVLETIIQNPDRSTP